MSRQAQVYRRTKGLPWLAGLVLGLSLCLLVPAAAQETEEEAAEETQQQEEAKEEQSSEAEARPAEKPRGVIVVDEGRQRVWKGEPISMSLKDADLKEVIRSFARLADINVIMDPGIEGTVTLELKDVPWDQAFSVILRTHGLAATIDGRVWTIGGSGGC